MSTTQEKIAQLEEDARKLVQNLEILYKKAGSYSTAKDELQKVISELLKLINETRMLSEGSHKIIENINEIGSSQIFNQLEKIDKGLFSFKGNYDNQSKSYKILLISAIVLLVITIILNTMIYIK